MTKNTTHFPTSTWMLTVTSSPSKISRLEAMDQASASARSKFKTSGQSSKDGPTAAKTSPRGVDHPKHPFENSKDLLVVLPNDVIDVEEETRLYDELRAATQSVSAEPIRPFSNVPLYVPITSRHLSNCPFRLLSRMKMTRITYRF